MYLATRSKNQARSLEDSHLSLDVRVPTDRERRRRFFDKLFWPVAIVAVLALIVVGAMTLPSILGVRQKLEKDLVSVVVYDVPVTKTQLIVGTGDKKLVAELPDGKLMPDGGREFMLSEVLNGNHWPRYENKRVYIRRARVQRMLGVDVVGVGTSPQNQILVHMPRSARPSKSDDRGFQVEVKSYISVAGILTKIPPKPQAEELFHIKKLELEPAPLPQLYVEAKTVKVVETKPLWGED